MQVIAFATWARTTHFNFFRRMDYPHYLICKNIDVTNFRARSRARGISFYYGMIYAAMQAINRINEFKYRIAGEQVVLHDTIHPSFTDMTPGSDLFKMVTVDLEDSIEAFVARAKEKADGQKAYFVREDVEGRLDLVFITCIPWVSFTNLSHTISFNKDDSIPRLAWGKYFEENGRLLMPFSIQAHHSFVDGIHMGRYYDVLQAYLDTTEF
jgi:chloramphenicol O-acetyltransferase type A